MEFAIETHQLSRTFDQFVAVDAIDLRVRPGQFYGFLGPNGAGKSTTMKMLTGFLPPTTGRATIAGFDVFDESIEARRRLGYLPENTPLYPEMKVGEFLRYRAALKGVPSSKVRVRVGDVLDLCQIKDRENQLIGALSKGYRQRVGLADALVHDPDLLILDEPTIGLDPNQIRTVRDLIKNFAEKRTVLISTHILPEVEMMCSRVIVIHKGEIRATDTAENLRKNHRAVGELLLEARAGADAVEALSRVDGVKDVTATQDGEWTLFALRLDAKAEPGLDIMRLAAERKWDVREIHQKRATLEDVFAELTTADQ